MWAHIFQPARVEFGFNFLVPPNNMPMNGLLLFIKTDTELIFKCMGFVIKHNPMACKPTGRR
jgi:hypothetical protein